MSADPKTADRRARLAARTPLEHAYYAFYALADGDRAAMVEWSNSNEARSGRRGDELTLKRGGSYG